jgi:hypothetical protein
MTITSKLISEETITFEQDEVYSSCMGCGIHLKDGETVFKEVYEYLFENGDTHRSADLWHPKCAAEAEEAMKVYLAGQSKKATNGS